MSQSTITYPTTSQEKIPQDFWFSEFRVNLYTKIRDFFENRIEQIRDSRPLSPEIIEKAKAAKNAPESDFVDL